MRLLLFIIIIIAKLKTWFYSNTRFWFIQL